jgi:hypothetical protein
MTEALISGGDHPESKKAYESPELVEHGSLEQITWGNILGPLEAPLQTTRTNS